MEKITKYKTLNIRQV